MNGTQYTPGYTPGFGRQYTGSCHRPEDDLKYLEANDQNTFSSCQRWHDNAHVSDDEWIVLFNEIKIKLEIKEKFKPEVIPHEVITFLKNKSLNETLLGQLSITNIFSEKFEACVKSFYNEKINERKNSRDEFDLENIFDWMKQEDVIFYTRTFLPLAVYFTYQEMHQETSRRDILKDLFNIGAGSRRKDLFPEVNPYCTKCFSDKLGSNFQSFNLFVFRMQLENNFDLPIDKENESFESDSDADAVPNTSVDSVKKFHINPFFSDSLDSSAGDDGKVAFHGEESPADNDEKVASDDDDDISADLELTSTVCIAFSNKCPICSKGFSKSKFVEMHKENFHSSRIKIVTQFVDEPEELMRTFCREDEPIVKKRKFVESISTVQKIRKSLRFNNAQ